jgi:small GTP-binding protein
MLNYIMSNYKYSFKLILLGDANVGKTTFTNLLVTDNLPTDYHSTIGVEFISAVIELKDKQKVKLMIWDTAGQERYRSITKAYFKDIIGVFLFFDLTNRESFNNIRYWYDKIKDEIDKTNGIIYIIGNKLDLVAERVVSNEDVLSFLDEINTSNMIKYKEISVIRDKKDVRDIYYEISEEIYLKIKEKTIDVKNNDAIININYKDKKNKKCC